MGNDVVITENLWEQFAHLRDEDNCPSEKKMPWSQEDLEDFLSFQEGLGWKEDQMEWIEYVLGISCQECYSRL